MVAHRIEESILVHLRRRLFIKGATMQNLYQGAQQGVRGIQAALQNPQRPFGVSLIAWAVGILGAIYLLLLLLDIAITNLFAGLASALSQASSPGSPNAFASLIPNLNQSTPSTLLALVYLTFMAAAYLGLARGLYLIKQWAYWTLLGLNVFNILIAFITLTQDHNSTLFISNIWIPLLISAYLLFIGGVRRAFRLPF
jgi:hypothetical protein